MMLKTDYPRIGETVLSETLANGLRLFIVPKPGYCKRYAFFATRYGGMDLRFCADGVWHETPAGVAHYLEHKLFDMEDGNALQILSQNGAEPNAFTANSMTAYYFDCTEHFEENLRLLLSFVSTPYFTQESVDKERGIIAQEILMTEDSPDWRVYKNLLGCLYRENPVRVPIAGTVESIAEITPELLYACHKAFYAPSNMALCVVGDVDAEAVKALAEEILPAAAQPSVERDYGAPEPAEVYQASVTHTMEIATPQFLAGFKCGAAQTGDALLREELLGELACDLLFGNSSPLYMRLYDQGLIDSGFGGGFDRLPGVAYAYVGGECEKPDAVVDAILAESARLVREGIDETFYLQTRRANFGASLRALNSFENIAAGIADGCFRGFDYYHFPALYESISQDDVLAFLKENFVAQRCAVSHLVPGKEADA